jgi:hypothetical protein
MTTYSASLLSRTALLAALCGLAVGRAVPTVAADAPIDRATPAERKLFEEIRPLVLKGAQPPFLQLADSGESYFWIVSARMIPLLRAHAYAQDPALLEAFVPLMEQVLSQRFIHPSRPEWNGWWHHRDALTTQAMVDHDSLIYFIPALLFVQEVRADPALRDRYGAKADAWLRDVEASIRAWDRRGCWHDNDERTGWYTQTTQFPEPGTGRLLERRDLNAGDTVPYNKVNCLYEALTLAYRITGDPWYRVRMEKSAKFWRDHWREDEQHVEWNYRDHFLPAHYEGGVVGRGKTKTGAWVHPKGGYYTLDVQGAMQLFEVGIFFDKADIEKLLKTNLEFMWRGDLPPTFRHINGKYDTSGAANRGRGYLWKSLAGVSPQVRDLWKAQIEASSRGWNWHADALEYLLEMSRPVAWEPRYAKEIPPFK